MHRKNAVQEIGINLWIKYVKKFAGKVQSNSLLFYMYIFCESTIDALKFQLEESYLTMVYVAKLILKGVHFLGKTLNKSFIFKYSNILYKRVPQMT